MLKLSPEMTLSALPATAVGQIYTGIMIQVFRFENIKQTKIILTVHDHGLLHKVLVHETADFAPVCPAELCGGFPDLEGSVFPEPVCSGNLVVQVDPIFELFADGLRRAPGKPLVERLRVGSEEPFHVNLKA